MTVKQLAAVRSEFQDFIEKDQAWSMSFSDAALQAQQLQQPASPTIGQTVDSNEQALQWLGWQVQHLTSENETTNESP